MANRKTDLNEKKVVKDNTNAFLMNLLTVGGVIIFSIILVILMKYFFIDKSYIKVNMSTDKKLEYITLEGQEELLSTQRYVSDLGYSMRYDIQNFKVLKTRNQDLYKFLHDERIIVFVSKSAFPSNCVTTTLDSGYSNCLIKVDDYTEEYYISNNNKTYKILVRTPNTPEHAEGVNKRIDYMLDTFEIVS